MLMCTYCALSPCELMLILMFRVNVGGGSFYLTSAFSGSRLWLIMANKQMYIDITIFPVHSRRWLCGKTTFWRITRKLCLLAPPYHLDDWDRQGQWWLVYTPAYSTAGLGQKAGGPFCPDGPSYPIFP